MTIASCPEITPETRIGDIVAARPRLASLFEGLHIDYCCGGKQTLAAASASRGLDTATVASMLVAAAKTHDLGPAAPDEVATLSLAALADHIEATHHVYVKEELPRLVNMAQRTARKHAERDSRLADVAAVLDELAAEMLHHMEEEEHILFPLVRRIEAGEAVDLAAPIAQLEAEHEAAGNLTAKLRLLTDGFTPGPEACTTHCALLAGLAAFEPDLHRHVHKENNILFPRALQRAAANAVGPAGGGRENASAR